MCTEVRNACLANTMSGDLNKTLPLKLRGFKTKRCDFAAKWTMEK